MPTDDYFMSLAIEQAKAAEQLDEVPVGAVIVKNGEIIACGYNRRETDKNALAHAEISAIDQACKVLGGWRLFECELFVTLEPCPMCMGAIINSRIKRLVFGASDYKAGCCGSAADFNKLSFNHKPEIVSGVLADECAALLSDFFKRLRNKQN